MNPYSFADKEIVKLKRFVNAVFHNTALRMRFDELNVLSTKKKVFTLMSRLKFQNKKIFSRVMKDSYNTAKEEAIAAGFTQPKRDRDIPIILAALLNRYHPVTEYKYSSEVMRKRDRLFESVVSASKPAQAREAFNKGARLWFNQSSQYVDFAVDEARKQAFTDMGVEFVKWVSVEDDRRCEECRELDGQIFPIDAIPDKPHHRCRCYLVPVVSFSVADGD